MKQFLSCISSFYQGIQRHQYASPLFHWSQFSDMVTSVCETGKRMFLVYSIMRIEKGKRELGMTIGLFSYQCSSSGHVPTEYLHVCQRHLEIIKSSSHLIIFFPPNLVLLYHSLASWSLFPSPLDLINVQVLFYLLSTSQICSLPSIAYTLFQETSSLLCTGMIAWSLFSLQTILCNLSFKCKLVHVSMKLRIRWRLLIIIAMIKTNLHQTPSWSLLLQAFAQVALSGLHVYPYSFV